MAWIANIIYALAAVFYLPVLAYQMFVQKKNRSGWRDKLLGPPRPAALQFGQTSIWVHAVSVGEVNASRTLVDELTERFPDHPVIVSSTTDTGFTRARQLFGDERVIRYPLDFSWAVSRTLDRLDPALIVLMELEVWYNAVTLAARRGLPVAVVNGRLTERSFRRLRRLGPLSRQMFSSLTWVGAQDDTIAERFRRLGTPRDRVTVTGSMKWDTAVIADRIDGQEELAAAVGIDTSRPLWVCGSTGPGEEKIILDAYEQVRRDRPDLQLAIVPRKPERFSEVADLIAVRGYECVRRSQHPDGQPWAPPADGRTAVILGDSMGELRKFYALSTVVFVGRSLVPMGGSDPMEVAALGKPIIAGPHMENFAVPTQELADANALETVECADHLALVVSAALAVEFCAATIGPKAREVVLANQGATERTIAGISALLATAGSSC